MMKKLYPPLLLFVSVFVTAALYAQTPVSPVKNLEGKTVHQARFGLFFEEYDGNSASPAYQFLGKYNPTPTPRFDTSDYRKHATMNTSAAGTKDLDFEAGDFNGDGFDDYVSVVLDTNYKPYITYTRMDTAVMKAGYSTGFEVNAVMHQASDAEAQSRLQLAAGNFDGNGVDDFVLGYADDNTGRLYLNWYWLNGGSVPVLRRSTWVALDTLGTGAFLFDSDLNSFHLCTGDFNGDGDDELAVGYLQPDNNNPQYITHLRVAIYDMEGGRFIYKGGSTIAGNTDANNCAIASGRFADSTKADLAFVWGRDHSGLGSTWGGVLKVDLTQASTNVISNVNTANNNIYAPANNYGECNVACGDFNGDGFDEVVIAGGPEGRILQINHPNYTITQKGYLSFYNIYCSACALSIDDIDRDNNPELISVGVDRDNDSDEFHVVAETVSSNLLSTSNKVDVPYHYWFNEFAQPTFPFPVVQYAPRRYALATGDFDGKVFTVGQGIHYVKTDVVQPLVILNAPPVHFDILNGTSYDVTQCFNANSCDFLSTYFTMNGNEIDVSTEVSQDWGVDAKLSAGGNFGVVDVGGYMSASYGEKFSNSAGSTTTVNISEEVSAVEDDLIYATVSNYDIWEYPVSRKGKPMGNMIVLKPTVTANQWYPSKSWNAFAYVPNHEVGNIMSYKNYPNLDNPDAAEKVKASYLGSSFTLGSNNNFHWSLEWSDVSSNSSVQQRDIGVEVGANVGAYGVSLEVNGSYSQSQLQTYKSTVTNQLSIKSDITSGLDMSIGEVRYTITPYTYWAQNGALVLDYAVQPELQTGGGTATWWYANYNIQDPAFILPWRYDPEKGETLQDQRKRRQTKSVLVYPQEAETGDTVKIRAVVHNFGLQATGGAITLKFYIGDPVNQNVITDINGNSSFSIPVINERERQIVEIDWKVSTGLYRFPRIYASIDPDNTITELHRNNNIGWNIFNVTDGSLVDPDSVTSVNEVDGTISLVECFPNPFGNDVKLSYEVKDAGVATITVCDVTGKVIATVLHQQKATGKHSISYDASDLSAGVYFFNFSLPGYSETKRLVKMGQ